MLTLWNGFDHNLNNELRKMDRLLDAAFRPNVRETFRPAMTAWPRVDVAEDDDAIRLEADVPGMTADDIAITLHEGVLVIEGKLQNQSESADEEAPADKPARRYLFRERSDLSFKRSFKLGRDLDPEAVTASVDNGVLTVVLPKKPQAQPRQIEITTK